MSGIPQVTSGPAAASISQLFLPRSRLLQAGGGPGGVRTEDMGTSYVSLEGSRATQPAGVAVLSGPGTGFSKWVSTGSLGWSKWHLWVLTQFATEGLGGNFGWVSLHSFIHTLVLSCTQLVLKHLPRTPLGTKGEQVRVPRTTAVGPGGRD